MLYEDLTGKALEACFEVAKELGAGFLESVYEKALLIAFQQKGLEVKAQIPLSVRFRGHVVGEFYADLLLENKVILELKAVRTLTPEHQAQLINYLNATDIEVGLLINFGNPRLEYKRLYRQQDSSKSLKGVL
ncbi:MAG: GxxExxY protein [Acidobacteria bacterium]|nr:GxxExxY protein [Acidobacteriota bacterium]